MLEDGRSFQQWLVNREDIHAEHSVGELREKVGSAPADDPIVVARGDDPRLLARDGLVGLGFSPVEAEQLLDGAPGETPEDLIAHALKGARR